MVDRRILKKGDTTGYSSICKMKADTDAQSHLDALGLQGGKGLLKAAQLAHGLGIARLKGGGKMGENALEGE